MGKAAKRDLHREDVVDFADVPDNVKEIEDKVVKDLSTDQHLLYRYIKAVSCGVAPQSLVTRKVGPLLS